MALHAFASHACIDVIFGRWDTASKVGKLVHKF